MASPRFGAPELTAGQAVPEATVNEMYRYAENAGGHFIFKDRDLATPPGSPADGDCYLVAASPTGAWSGQAGKIAFLLNTSWAFVTPREGYTAWVNDEDVFVGYDGAAWGTLSAGVGSFQPLDSDLTAIAALTTTSFGRSFLALADAAASRTLVGATTIGGNLLTLTNPSAIAFPRYNADNSVSALSASAFRTAIGAGTGTGSGDLLSTNNLSDVASASTARTNLGAAARTPSIQAVTSSATVTPTFADDQVNITAQAAALALANPTGTAVDGWGVAIRIKDNGTARAITYGTQYRALGVTLPTTTVASKTLYLGMSYNSADTKWDVLAAMQEA